MKFIRTDKTDLIDQLRIELYQRFSAPIDGMWQDLYIASSQAYLIEDKQKCIGYCCIDNKDRLTQIFLHNSHNYRMDVVIHDLIASEQITTASLSSIETVSFNACLAAAKSIQKNTFCFQYAGSKSSGQSLVDLTLVEEKEEERIKGFIKNQIAFEDTFGYVKNLIKRKELYMLKEGTSIIATGECRRSDSQLNVADLGVIVNKDYQKKGIGSQVLMSLTQKAQELKRTPICSTTYDNIASKKAIEKAGFYCSHIIFDMNFIADKI